MEDWAALGRAVYRARARAGYRDTARWAARIGRSTRVALGLERGEPTGPRTLMLIEDALGWPAGWTSKILSGEADGEPTVTEQNPQPAPEIDPRPVGLGLDDEADGLTPEQIESVRAVIRAMKPSPENA